MRELPLAGAAAGRAGGGANVGGDSAATLLGPVRNSWTREEALDLVFFFVSLATFVLYHCWYYGWRALPRTTRLRGYQRLDYVAQRARRVFVTSMLVPGADCNLSIQVGGWAGGWVHPASQPCLS